MIWDLATRENWQLILADQRVVDYVDNTQPTQTPYKYNPIEPIYATPNTHALLVGTRSSTAKLRWKLGAYVSQYLYVSPSDTGNFSSGVQIGNAQIARLNNFTFLQFPNHNVSPYVLKIEIPYWIEDIYIEVWEYTAEFTPIENLEDIQLSLSEILNRLDNIDSAGFGSDGGTF